MDDVVLIDPSQLPASDHYPASHPVAAGRAEIRWWESPVFHFFAASVSLQSGGSLEWLPDHGEEAIFVLEGEIEAPAGRCGQKGAVIIESGCPVSIEARTRSRLLHVGRTSGAPPFGGPYGPPEPAGHRVHVFDPEGLRVTRPAEGFEISHYADSGCPTCRVGFFRVRGECPTVAPSHSHSSPELITVTEGTLQVGPLQVTAGSTIAIAADRRYGFRTKGAYEFVNYRPDVSFITTSPGEPPRLEAGPLRIR